MIRIFTCLLLCCLFFNNSFSQINEIAKASKKIDSVLIQKDLKNFDFSNAIKDLLRIGVNYSFNSASQSGGFYNSIIKIPFPEEISLVKTTLIKLGLQKKVSKFEKNINYCAELSCKNSAQIVIKEVERLSIVNAYTIIKAENNAATNYLKKNCSKNLYAKFHPIIEKEINQLNLQNSFDSLLKRYNKIPFMKKVKFDLVDYITQKTIEGIFILITNKEIEIRGSNEFHSTDLLRKVFK